MVDVQLPATAATFSSLSEAQRQAALSFLLVSDHDAVLDGAWDLTAKTGIPSSSVSTSPGDVSSPSSSKLSSRSSSPPQSAPSPSTSSLLVRAKHQGWERSFELHNDWPLPKIEREDEVLIEHRCVGLNPVDFKSILYNFGIPSSPWVLGRDIAGVVAGVGSAVEGVRVGQRVWTCADARDVRAGAYQRYSISRGVHLGQIPDDTSDEQASTLGTGLVTAAIIAYWFFKWPRATAEGSTMPRSNAVPVAKSSQHSPWLLIYGGGAITGIYLAQLARLSGLRTIAVASPSNFEYLQSNKAGVHHCVDRYASADTIAQQIDQLVGDEGLAYVVDCVGSKTAAQCHQMALDSRVAEMKPTEMVCLAGDPKVSVEGDTVQLHRISFSTTFYGDDVFARAVLEDLNELLRTGRLHPVKYEVVPDGLAGVRRGLERLRDNQAPRVCKLIVNVTETPHAHSTNLGVRAESGWNGVV